MRKQFISRIRLIVAILILVAILFIVQLYLVQVVHGAQYRDQAEGQYVASAEGISDRGVIYFAGEKEAATMRMGYRLALRPGDLEDAEGVYTKLNALVPIDEEKFFMSAKKVDDPYEEIAAQVPKEIGEKIIEMKLSGVIVERDRWRFYPGGSLASQVLGFVGFGPNNRDRPAGLYGLERYWGDTLARSSNGLYVNFFAEIFANLQFLIARNDTAREGNLLTHIDADVERQLEQIIDGMRSKYYAQISGGIVMDPKTGAIIAMAGSPRFDPNDYANATSSALYRNLLVENEYELGSIMKPITMAAGIDAGVITPQTTYTDKGSVVKAGIKISNYDGRGRGAGTTMQEVLNQSLNTGVVFVSDRLGHETFSKYLRMFGLGEETGIDLPNEVPGHIAAYKSNSDADYASASFGQSFSVTSIAMTRALAALANGGLLVQPRVVRAIQYPSGITRPVYHPEPTRVISEDSSEAISRMLVTVYDDALLGGDVKMDHYSIAAKTGTAQMAKSDGGGYYDDRYLHSFFGYFPAYDARFIVFLFIVDPKGEAYASHTLTYPFVDMTKFLINYYDIPPDR